MRFALNLLLKVILPAILVPLLAAGALLSGVMPVAGNAFLEDAQGALNEAIDQVGETVSDVVDKVQDTPKEPAPVETTDPVTEVPDESPEPPASVAEITIEPLDLPGYLPGTANGVALLQTTRVDSSTHQGWVDITLDLMLMSLIPEEAIEPSISLSGDGTQACFPSSGGHADCLGVDWGSKEQFAAVLQPRPLGSETWPKGKARPWTVGFQIPANAQVASFVYGNERVQLNLGGDTIYNTEEHEVAESYRPPGSPGAPTGTEGYFVGKNHGIAIRSITQRVHATEPTWSIVDLGIDVMTFAEGDALDLPIDVQINDGLACFMSVEESDCVQILWGGINQFDAILSTRRTSGMVSWPRSKGWPVTLSFVVPASISGATLLYGPNASHLDLRGEAGDSLPWDFTTHYNSLTGLTLHDQATQTIDLVALERDPVTADVLLIFEAINDSEDRDFFPRIAYDGSRVSEGGQVFDGLDPASGWSPQTRMTTTEALAPGQRSQIVITIPRVSGPGFPEIAHSDDPPVAMLLRLYADTNSNAAAAFEVDRSDPFYVAFEKTEGDDDAKFFFPDLEITGLTLSPEHPTVGDTVTATFNVTNMGPRNAQAFNADLMVDDVYNTSTSVPAIAAHESTSASMAWIATLAPAVLTVVIDPENAVAESAVDNNTATVPFIGGALPDLTVASVTMIPPSTENGNIPRFEITMINQGKGVAKPYKVIATTESQSVFFMQFAKLAPGASQTQTYPWTTAIGSGAVKLSVDSANSIHESDETNNIYTAGLPDLTTSSNAVVKFGKDGSAFIAVELTNAGEMAAPSTQMRIIVDGQAESAQLIQTGPIGPHETISLRSANIPNLGRHRIEILIDASDSIPETDGGNNSFSFTYTIGPLADLVASSISLTPNPFTFGELLTLEFMVMNRGGKSSEMTIAEVYDPVLDVLLGSAVIPSIDPGEQKNVTFRWTVETALTSVEIVLDPGLLVDETDEDNNSSVMVLN
jgi:subtilase family serine protease